MQKAFVIGDVQRSISPDSRRGRHISGFTSLPRCFVSPPHHNTIFRGYPDYITFEIDSHDNITAFDDDW